MRTTANTVTRAISRTTLCASTRRTVFPARLISGLLLCAAVVAAPARGDDYFWNAGQPYNQGPWVGCDYSVGYPDRPCGHDAEGYPVYALANFWQRTCCGCTSPPYPHEPSDRAYLGSNYGLYLYSGCGRPECDVSLAALDLGWKGQLSVDVDLAVTEPVTIPASCLVSLNHGCHLDATVSNQGEIDGYMSLDQVITLTGALHNTGRVYLSGTWAAGGGPGTLTNAGAGYIEAIMFDTDLSVINAGQLMNLAYQVTLRSAFTQTAGTLLVNGASYGTLVTNWQPLDIQGGMICGEGPITGQVNNSSGVLAPGFPAGWWFSPALGRMTVGGLTQGSDATLQIRLAQGDGEILYPTQQADQVQATGHVTLAGTLKLIHAAPQLPGERYIVVSAAGISGQFEHVDGPGQYTLTYEPTRVILSVVDPGAEQTAPTLNITSPTAASEFTTGLLTVDLAGTAGDDVEVTAIGWSNGVQQGVAVGTNDWSAPSIPLQPGRNVVTVTAEDAAGNTTLAQLAVTRLSPPWDLDGNGVVDSQDLEWFRACVSGPAIRATAACQGSDLDNDGDVDQNDFGLLQRCFRGPNVPADPDCLP